MWLLYAQISSEVECPIYVLQNRKGNEKKRAKSYLYWHVSFSPNIWDMNTYMFSIRMFDVYFPFTRIPLGQGRKWSDGGGRLKQYQNLWFFFLNSPHVMSILSIRIPFCLRFRCQAPSIPQYVFVWKVGYLKRIVGSWFP